MAEALNLNSMLRLGEFAQEMMGPSHTLEQTIQLLKRWLRAAPSGLIAQRSGARRVRRGLPVIGLPDKKAPARGRGKAGPAWGAWRGKPTAHENHP